MAPAYLILDHKLHTLNRSSGGLRNCGSNTTHCDKGSVQSIGAGFTKLTQEIYHKAEALSLARMKDMLGRSCKLAKPNQC